ncbi:unnamed protein product [Adineta steineri]|uniref:Uncharacterized protein n=1 Tax=Adineta steineri TaxID=433720 RepID=A0A819KTP8_9BILA|nr:unnamed protein product [Adineta steineri]CAF1475592.1 unnamed protein product [Adineta steineri]CAF3564935.1 unnamed protein product [Adineta steineri]CAF3951583.1 unnamed protein product [Adineta steineri]
MSTSLTNRAQSASARTVRRSSTNNQASQFQQRPTTSVGTRRSHTDVFITESTSPFELSISPEERISHRRLKSARTSRSKISASTSRTLQLDELRDLLQSNAQGNPYTCKIDCLASFQKLKDCLNLRTTPMDYRLLYDLYKLENRIIQANACNDLRFRSLIDTLVPIYVIEVEEEEEQQQQQQKNINQKKTVKC